MGNSHFANLNWNTRRGDVDHNFCTKMEKYSLMRWKWSKSSKESAYGDKVGPQGSCNTPKSRKESKNSNSNEEQLPRSFMKRHLWKSMIDSMVGIYDNLWQNIFQIVTRKLLNIARWRHMRVEWDQGKLKLPLNHGGISKFEFQRWSKSTWSQKCH